MKRKASRTSIATERPWVQLVIVLEEIDLLVEIVVGAADGRAAAVEDGIADAAGVVAGLAAVVVGTADAAGLAEEDTKPFCHGFTRIMKRATLVVALFYYGSTRSP